MSPNFRTIPDPELPPDSGELLFFVLVELDFANISEIKRVCELEMQGGIDKTGLKEFVKAGQGNPSLRHADLVNFSCPMHPVAITLLNFGIPYPSGNLNIALSLW